MLERVWTQVVHVVFSSMGLMGRVIGAATSGPTAGRSQIIAGPKAQKCRLVEFGGRLQELEGIARTTDTTLMVT